MTAVTIAACGLVMFATCIIYAVSLVEHACKEKREHLLLAATCAALAIGAMLLLLNAARAPLSLSLIVALPMAAMLVVSHKASRPR